MYSFGLLFVIGTILFFINIYPRRSQKSMGAMGKKMSSFFLTNILIVFLVFLALLFYSIYSLGSFDPFLSYLLLPD
jgi:hypothetical protein